MMDDDGGGAASPDDEQRQQPALPPTANENAALPSLSQSQSEPTATSAASASDSDSQALEALLRALPPSQILYLSLPSTTPLPSAVSSLSKTPSRTEGETGSSTRNETQDAGQGQGNEACEYLVRGGAVGEWAAARGGCDWDEVEELGILPSREDLDRFAAAAAEVAEEEE